MRLHSGSRMKRSVICSLSNGSVGTCWEYRKQVSALTDFVRKCGELWGTGNPGKSLWCAKGRGVANAVTTATGATVIECMSVRRGRNVVDDVLAAAPAIRLPQDGSL